MHRKIGITLIGLAAMLIPIFVIFVGQNVNFHFLLFLVFILLIGMVPFGAFLIAYPAAPEKRKRIKLVYLLTSLSLVIPGILSRLELFTLPFTSIFIIVGIFWYCLAYAPLELSDKRLKWSPFAKNRTEILVLSSLDFLGLNLLAIYALIRFMHWPGGLIVLTIGISITLAGVLSWNFKFKREIVNRKKNEDTIKDQFDEIQASITYAKRIQLAILPPNKLIKENLQDSFILYRPKDIVAGDFYWMEPTVNGVLFAAADCTGHGVPGAMVSVICNAGLNRSVREFGLSETGAILDKTRELVLQEFEKSEEEVKDGMDIALCKIDGASLSYSGANNPLWIVRKGEVLETKADKQPIGKYDSAIPFTTHTLELEKGDTIYIFSDGFPDQFGGEKGKKYKSGNFKKFLVSIQDLSMDDQKNRLEQEFIRWRGELEQIDDVCVIGVRV
jgi:hypothetical protein